MKILFGCRHRNFGRSSISNVPIAYVDFLKCAAFGSFATQLDYERLVRWDIDALDEILQCHKRVCALILGDLPHTADGEFGEIKSLVGPLQES